MLGLLACSARPSPPSALGWCLVLVPAPLPSASCFPPGDFVAVRALSPCAGILGLVRKTSSHHLVTGVDLDVGLAGLAAHVVLWGEAGVENSVVNVFPLWVLPGSVLPATPPHSVSSVSPL